MHILAHVLLEAWNALPAAVREDRDLTGVGGLPTTTVRQYLLREFVTVSRAKLLGKDGALSDDERARVISELRVGAPRLVEIVAWLQTIRDGDAIPNVERRVKAARDLVRARPGERALLSDAEAADVVREVVEGLRRSRTLSADDLRKVARGTGAPARAERARLNDHIATVWAERPESVVPDWRRPLSAQDRASARIELDPERRADLLRYGLTVAFSAFSAFDGKSPIATPESAWVWDRLVSEPPVPSDDTTFALGLLRSLPTSRPELTGVLPRTASKSDLRTGPGQVSDVEDVIGPRYFPLEANIHARLLLALQDQTAKFPAELTAVRAFELAIDASVRPSGLPYPWADAVLAIGGAVAGLLTWSPSADENRRREQSLTGGAATIVGRWLGQVAMVRKRGDRALGADVIHLYQNPTSYYIRRLWNRILRQCLLSPQAPAADVVWGHVYGAFTSTREQLVEMAASREFATVINIVADDTSGDDGSVHAIDTIAFESASEGAPPRAPVFDVLHHAGEQGSGRAVLEFWNAVAALSDRQPDPPELVAAWEGWAVEYLRAYPREAGPFRAETAFEVVFAIARVEITMRGPLNRPTSGIGTTEVFDKGTEL